MRFFLVFCIVAALLYHFFPYHQDFKVVEVTESTYIRKVDTVALEANIHIVDSITTLIASYGIKFPDVVLVQMIHETNWFRSNIYKECLNPFGMKYNDRGLAKHKCRGHAGYETIVDALLDYRIWQARCLKLRPDVKTQDQYLKMLDDLPLCKGCRYAEDPNYVQRLKGYLKELEKIKNIKK